MPDGEPKAVSQRPRAGFKSHYRGIYHCPSLPGPVHLQGIHQPRRLKDLLGPSPALGTTTPATRYERGRRIKALQGAGIPAVWRPCISEEQLRPLWPILGATTQPSMRVSIAGVTKKKKTYSKKTFNLFRQTRPEGQTISEIWLKNPTDYPWASTLSTTFHLEKKYSATILSTP